MTDHELLVWAVKATGADYHVDPETFELEALSPIGGMSGSWNPLTDDGDALRLATTLRLSIEISGCQIYARNGGGLLWNACALRNSDSEILAATRRAIVNAAAGIGAAQ